MAAAYGLYSHIQSNKRRSIALLFGLFFLVYLMVFAGALLAEALSHDASLDGLIRKALQDLIWAAPGLFSNPGKFYHALTLMKRNLPGDKDKSYQLLNDVVTNNLAEKNEAEKWLKKW